jgi:hypothetical protein
MKNFGIICLALVCSLCTICCGNGGGTEKTTVKSDNSDLDTSAYSQIEQEIAKENKNKFYVIENKAVIFFMPVRQEVKDFLKELGESYTWEAEALFNDFAKQANSFQSIIQRQNIKCAISTNEKFEIRLKNGKVVIFDRIEQDQIIGQILTDGVQQPQIKFGMYNNRELAGLIQVFFKINSLGYVPPDTIVTEEKVVDTVAM